MCGIAGLATAQGRREADGRLVDDMLAALAHRGPDDQWAIGDDHAIVGSRRLSIIDLDGGRQPLLDESGQIVVSQNGEIYNYVELNAELARRGHRFGSRSDTETIAHLYEEVGPEFVHRLRGMFAIAIWDRTERRLVLARDRLGKKPLYWRLDGGRLAYASELKALLRDPETPRDVDRTALAQYLEFGYVPAPRSILRGIQKLPPASVLSWDGGEPRITRYWSPPHEPVQRRTDEEDREACLGLLREAVQLRLRSDVPMGVFLSGGMDSSVVTALAAESSPTPIRTFSIGFRDDRYNELPYARVIAERFGTRHAEDVVDLDAVSLLPALSTAFDEPFGDSSAIPTYRVAQIAAEDVKVVLTGDGGDEIFGGYDRYLLHDRTRLAPGLPGALHRAAVEAGRTALRFVAPRSVLRSRADKWARLIRLSDDARYVDLMSPMAGEDRAAMLRHPELAVQDAYLLDALASGPATGSDRLQHADLLTYLPGDLLVKMDRATMANSLEARSPLLDHRLVEFMSTRPTERKVMGGRTKILLRQVAGSLLPQEILDRPKKGFSVPVHEWFRTAMGDQFRDLVLTADARTRDHLDAEVARRLLAHHQSRKVRAGHTLWKLLMFELWARAWLDMSASAAPNAASDVVGDRSGDGGLPLSSSEPVMQPRTDGMVAGRRVP
jgi:asparagine synthase (glutamine-hydrolysing)